MVKSRISNFYNKIFEAFFLIWQEFILQQLEN
jgi:hypothetical protein